jgi:hypothetical protein
MPKHVPGYNPPIPSPELVFGNALYELGIAEAFLDDEASPAGDMKRRALVELCDKIAREYRDLIAN